MEFSNRQRDLNETVAIEIPNNSKDKGINNAKSSNPYDVVNYLDLEDEEVKKFTEENKINTDDAKDIERKIDLKIRNDFITKVYSIIGIQLFVTFCICIPTIMPEYSEFLINNYWILITAIVIWLINIISITCFQETLKRVPLNYILLFTMTLCLSIMLSYITVYTPKRAMLLTFLLTTILVSSLTLYAYFAKLDLSILISVLIVLLISIIFVLICCLIYPTRFLQFIYCGIFVILFSLYLILDTQLILGNLTEGKYDVDDYIIAALNVYYDIFFIFVYLYAILRGS